MAVRPDFAEQGGGSAIQRGRSLRLSRGPLGSLDDISQTVTQTFRHLTNAVTRETSALNLSMGARFVRRRPGIAESAKLSALVPTANIFRSAGFNPSATLRGETLSDWLVPTNTQDRRDRVLTAPQLPRPPVIMRPVASVQLASLS